MAVVVETMEFVIVDPILRAKSRSEARHGFKQKNRYRLDIR